jgi:hypothetical protein
LITATFITKPTASFGMVHFPLVPRTLIAYASFTPIGVERGPTLSVPARVSITRHGVIGTYTARSPEPIEAEVVIRPPAPKLTATAAPMAAHRLRDAVADRVVDDPVVDVEVLTLLLPEMCPLPKP